MSLERFRLGLLPRIVIAIALGIGAGFVLPEWLARCFETFNSIFSSFLGFLIPLLIIGFVAPAIAEIGRRAGRMLVVTALIAYVMTFGSGMFAYMVSSVTFPNVIPESAHMLADGNPGVVPSPFFTVPIEPLTGVMTALVFAFVVGLGASRLETTALRRGLDDFRSVINWAVAKIVIPCLPLYIFGIFMGMAMAGTVGAVLATFAGIVVIIFVMHIALLLAQYGIAALFSGYNPLKALWTMMPAYFTALGTQSSAATIPVTLKRTVKMGVDPDVAGFVIPLCATIHMSGSTLKIVSCAVALMIIGDMPYDVEMFAGFIAMLGITIIAAPGVPGGAIMASLGLLSSILGFSDADNALMIALYIAMDSFGTACNITGDGSIAQIVARLFKNKSC